VAQATLIPMGDWSGSTDVDPTDIIEATGAENGKTAKLSCQLKLWPSENQSCVSHGEVFFFLTCPLMGDPISNKIVILKFIGFFPQRRTGSRDRSYAL